MRRMTRQVNRTLDRALGRGSLSAAWRVFKVFFILSIALSLMSMCSPDAQAATAAAAEPPVKCGQEITWDAASLFAPATAEGALRFAYAEVAEVTGTTAFPGMPQDIEWDWQHPLSGVGYVLDPDAETPPPVTYEGSAVIGDRTYTVHAIDGEHDYPDAHWRQQVLRLVVEDFGVHRSTSTAEGLSARDRRALQAICDSQADEESRGAQSSESAGPARPDSKKHGTEKSGRSEAEPFRASAASGIDDPQAAPGGTVGLMIVITSVVLVVVYALLGDRVLAPFIAIRRRLVRRRTRSIPADDTNPVADRQVVAND